MDICDDKKEEFGKRIMEFLDAIHGENSYEIRFIPEGKDKDKKENKIISILKHDGFLYTDSEGKRVKVYEATISNFANYLNECLMFAGHTSVCFTVNSPNIDFMKSCITTDDSIKNGGSINAQFVDIDAPKEIKGNLHSVEAWKKTVKANILAFPLRPSIVVETKNGYHVYWLLENGQHKLFRYIQKQLIVYFGGDKNCENESRLLRLPYFWHRKDVNNPFEVEVKIFEPQSKYKQDELKNALPELEKDICERVSRSTNIETMEYLATNGAKREDIFDLLTNKIAANIVKETDEKIIMHCCMPNHPDRKPSAFINTESLWYYCSGCRTNKSILELAKELGWKDIVEAWNKYDIDIESKLIKIKDQMIDVQDLPHLSLNVQEQENVTKIAYNVIGELGSFGQTVNARHKKYINDTVQVLYKAQRGKPYLIPLDMGGGKSLIIKSFITEMIKKDDTFGAIVVVERIADVKRIAKELNDVVGKDIAFPMYGFKEDECLLNKNNKQRYTSCLAVTKHRSCSFKSKCRFINQSQNQEQYPIIVMTTKRLSLISKNLDAYAFYKKEGEVLERELLIIDEKPDMIDTKTFSYNEFKQITGNVLMGLEAINFNDNDKIFFAEFNEVIELVEELYTFEDNERIILEPLDNNFEFSDGFSNRFNSLYDYSSYEYGIKGFLESLMRNGGYKDAFKEKDVSITTSYYISCQGFENFKTCIFDGTADIDVEYQHDLFHVINFKPIRTYEELTFNVCNTINASKSSLNNDKKMEAFCEDVKNIADENPSKKIYLPIFKNKLETLNEHLEEYIKSGQIILATYGSTKGSNAFKECSLVVLGGILHKGEEFYIGKSKALLEEKGENLDDLSCSKFEGKRRFNDRNIEVVKILDMLVDYSQEIKRSSQRNNTENVPGKVYIFHNDKILLDLIGTKFPKCKIEEWIPSNLVENKIYGRRNATVQQAFCDYIKNNSHKNKIMFVDIKKVLNINDKQFSNLKKNEKIIDFIKVNGYEVRKNEKNKRQKELVKVN